jgi:hypothetical protein
VTEAQDKLSVMDTISSVRALNSQSPLGSRRDGPTLFFVGLNG